MLIAPRTPIEVVMSRTPALHQLPLVAFTFSVLLAMHPTAGSAQPRPAAARRPTAPPIDFIQSIVIDASATRPAAESAVFRLR
jgi:hypothetical protein